MATAAHPRAPEEAPKPRRNWQRWALALILIAAIAGAALHFGDLRQFALLLRRAHPAWLLAAAGLQVLTYVFVAAGWYVILEAGGSHLRLRRLFSLALAKLFTDQAVPTAGVGGNVLMVDRLIAFGVPRGHAAAALILSTIGYYAGFALLGLGALGVLWREGKATWLLGGTLGLFLLGAFALPAPALCRRRRGRGPMPRRVERLAAVRPPQRSVAEARS